MNSNKTLNLNTTFKTGAFTKVMGMLILFVCIALLCIGSIVIHNNNNLEQLVQSQEQLRTSGQDVYESLLVFEKNRSWRNLKIATGKVHDDLSKNNETIEQNINSIEALYYTNIMMSIAAGFLALVLLVYTGRILLKNKQFPHSKQERHLA